VEEIEFIAIRLKFDRHGGANGYNSLRTESNLMILVPNLRADFRLSKYNNFIQKNPKYNNTLYYFGYSEFLYIAKLTEGKTEFQT